MVDIVYFTYNHLSYTKKTLPAMINNAGVDFSLTIIDNGSTDGTVEYLKSIQKEYDRTVKKILFNSTGNHPIFSSSYK